MEITNCHVHIFTQAHTPDRFLPWPVPQLVRIPPVRRILSWIARLVDREQKTALGRYAQIIETSYKKTEREVFEIVRGFYPEGTRFVLLAMDTTKMNAGGVAVGIDAQHAELVALRRAYPRGIVIPFAAVDPRHEGIVEKTIALIEQHDFRAEAVPADWLPPVRPPAVAALRIRRGAQPAGAHALLPAGERSVPR